MEITVNGKTHHVAILDLSFSEGVGLGLWNMNDTVTYRSPGESLGRRRAGELVRGQDVLIEDGMVFTAVNTGNA